MSRADAAKRGALRSDLAPPASIKLGLITDIRYADKDDAKDRAGRRTYRFRNALGVAERAVECWNAAGVKAVVQLGNAIDVCGTPDASRGAPALSSVLGVLNKCHARKRFDVVGNHDLRSFPRAGLSRSRLRCFGDRGKLYRSEQLNEHWQAIVLDGYEHAVVGLDDTDPGFQAADKMLRRGNPNIGQHMNDLRAGLQEHMQRFVPSNGAVSEQQLRWLRDALCSATEEGRKVIVLSHLPIYAGAAAKHQALMWNADEVLRVLHDHRETVVAVFAGHDQDGGYDVDQAGLHHVTLTAAVTAELGAECCAVLECFDSGAAKFVAHGKACAGNTELELAGHDSSEPTTPTTSSSGQVTQASELRAMWGKLESALGLAKVCMEQVFATCGKAQQVATPASRRSG